MDFYGNTVGERTSYTRMGDYRWTVDIIIGMHKNVRGKRKPLSFVDIIKADDNYDFEEFGLYSVSILTFNSLNLGFNRFSIPSLWITLVNSFPEQR